jgi:hypothetical protein
MDVGRLKDPQEGAWRGEGRAEIWRPSKLMEEVIYATN